MTRARAPLRSLSSRNPVVADLARDVQRKFDEAPARSIVDVVANYAEPLFLALDREPAAITLLRIREVADPEAEIPASAIVSFKAVARGVHCIVSGPVEGTRYRFVFEVVG